MVGGGRSSSKHLTHLMIESCACVACVAAARALSAAVVLWAYSIVK
jgi:hypothetical protein